MIFFILWQGKGGIVLVAAVAAVAIPAIAGLFLPIPDGSMTLKIAELVTAVALSIPIWIYGKKWNAEKKEYIDKETGKDVTIYSRNTFFLIPMQYWAFILPALFAFLSFA